MKKYYQLLLVIVSVISVVSLIIYRNQYNRLRYVLEVLNFFGKPSDKDQLNCIDFNHTLIEHNVYNIPSPAWQEIDDNHYVYSAFWQQAHIGGEVIAIAIGLPHITPEFMCNVWFPDQVKPVTGKFSYTPVVLIDADDYNAYLFVCKLTRDFGVPFGVVFFNTEDTKPALNTKIPVYIQRDGLNSNATLACVVPDIENTKRSGVIEFLNYHQLIGVTQFIVYDNGQITNALTNTKLGYSITTLPWNLPFKPTSQFSEVVSLDCAFRTAGQVESIFVASWNEFIVPKHHTTINTIIHDFDVDKHINTFRIPVLEFCTDLEVEHDTKEPLIMQKLHFRRSKVVAYFNITRPHIGNKVTISTQIVAEPIAAVHKYTKCFKNSYQTLLSQSDAMLRFQKDFKRTVLYKLWKTGHIFKTKS